MSSSQSYVAAKNATCATCKRSRYASLATCPFCPPPAPYPASPSAMAAAAPTTDFLDDPALEETGENPCGEAAAHGEDQKEPDAR